MVVGSEVVRASTSVSYEELEDLAGEQGYIISRQQEMLARVAAQIDNKGWNQYQAGNAYTANGLDMNSLKKAHATLQEWIVAGGIMKRISDLQGFYTYGHGVGFKTMGTAKKAFESDELKKRIFSATGLEEINRLHGTAGTIFFRVNPKTKEVIRLPFEEIGQPWTDSDDPERIWYIKRSWNKRTIGNPNAKLTHVYYPTNETPTVGLGYDTITESDGTIVPIDKDFVVLAWSVNRQVGWPLGVPDLFPSLQWAEKYTTYLKNQAKYAEALAMIAYQFKGRNPDEAKKMAASVAGASQAGGAATGVDGMDIVAMKGNSDVSFENGKPLAAQAAAAANMLVDETLGEGGVAAAESLDPMVKRWVESRREAATTFFQALGKLLGGPKLEVIWPELEGESPFREAQMIIGAWATGLFEADELRGPIAQRIRIPIADGSKAPEDVLIPNTEKTLELTAKIAAKNAPAPSGGGSNAQGKDALGVGKTSDGKDQNQARNNGELN